MSKSLEQILGFAPLTEALRTSANGVPNPFPDAFFTVNPANRVLGDQAKYIRLSGERRTALRAKYGSPARRRTLRDVGEQAIRCLHNFESIHIDPNVLLKLQAFEQYTQDEGMDWLRYQLDAAAVRQQNTRVITVASMLRSGKIYWDSDGNLLPTSSGADASLTIDAGVPATHINQCNGNISQSWALHNTDIPTDIRNLQQFSIQETGMRLTTALYGVNIPKYFVQNDYSSPFLSRSGDVRDKFNATGELPSGLYGIQNWIPVYTSFYEDSAGTNQEIWSDDLVVFMPDLPQPDKMSWYALYEGSIQVPKTIDVLRDPAGVLAAGSVEYGMFAYGALSYNPIGAEVFFGDTHLPMLRNPSAPFMATVAF